MRSQGSVLGPELGCVFLVVESFYDTSDAEWNG